MSTTAERLASILDEFIAEREEEAGPAVDSFMQAEALVTNVFKLTRALLADIIRCDKESDDAQA